MDMHPELARVEAEALARDEANRGLLVAIDGMAVVLGAHLGAVTRARRAVANEQVGALACDVALGELEQAVTRLADAAKQTLSLIRSIDTGGF